MQLLTTLITPACIIDEPKMAANAQRVAQHCEQQGVALRPHVKTLRSLEAASIYAPVPMPITVSTLAEAHAFSEAGYQDILYAVGLSPNKFEQVNTLLNNAVTLTVVIDSTTAAEQLCAQASMLEQPLRVAIEIDVDQQRAGMAAIDPELITVANKIAATPSLIFAGVMAHAGASYGCFDATSRNQMAQQECQQILLAAKNLEEAGLPCAMISAGSTPTVLANASRDGLTELRAGVYATFDLVMAGLGVCSYTDIALSVLTCVIGHQKDKNWVLVDAGWMALSRDTGTQNHAEDCGYGLVCDIEGNVLDGWYVSHTNQEHGVIKHKDGLSPGAAFAYGTMLRILPVHACATAGQFNEYHVTQDNRSIQSIWPRIVGW
ncbi:alanine racemase [Alteromonas lipotrueiana]|uniref:alanine racemase n=1 Tax=Alteromonas lipotrueiana TaxID=2803815 RepID=UPI001C47ADF7|nr:alanine racemase [Alteromonas lipotrueiana]